MKKKQLTEHFNLSEFRCHDGTDVPADLECNTLLLAHNLEVLRGELGESVHITSGYRSPAWNKKVGGAKESQHMEGKAADITVQSKTPKQVAAVIERLIAAGKMKQGGLGLYPGWVHYDVRGTKARW